MMPRRIAAIVLCSLALSGCGAGSWLGGAEDPPLPGERLSVLARGTTLQADATAQLTKVTLPPPEANGDWPQAGGNAAHAMHHLVVSENPERLWSRSIGSAPSSRTRLLAQPVMADGKIFAIDADNDVTALDAKTGQSVWSQDITPDYESGEAMSGGLAFENGRIFAATGFAEVVAMDVKTGEILWRSNVSAPMRAAPTARGGRVFVVTVDNKTHALAQDDGRLLWTHSGVDEVAGILGAASPAVDSGAVIVPYSSGEIYALRVENGGVLWVESLAGARRTQAVSTLTDIRGRPVVDRGRMYAVGNSDTMVAVDMRTGRRIWDREIGSIQNPWLAGDYLFAITNNAELAAIEAATGSVAWVTPLQQWQDSEDRTGRIVWSGPVLASDRLIVTSSHGWAVSISPYSGEVLSRERLPDGVTIAPLVADGILYFLTETADIVAYR